MEKKDGRLEVGIRKGYVPLHLPSKCLTYPEMNCEKIQIRPFKGEDEEIISELNVKNVKEKLLRVISNVIVGVDPEILTSGDTKYIMLWEAINSYGPEYPVKLVCESCNRDITVTIDLGELENEELPDDFEQPQTIQLATGPIKVRLLTLRDEVDILNRIAEGDPSYLYSYAKSIVSKELSILAKMEILKELSTKDLNKIREFHKKYEHGPNLETDYKCPKCKYEGKLVVPFQFGLLFSFDR